MAPRAAVARATLLLLLAAAGFGSLAVLTVLGTRAGASLALLMVGRYGLGALLLGALAGWRALRLPARQAGRLLVLGGGGQTLVTLLSLSALRWLPAATLGFLFYTYPAWVTLIAAARGQERLDRWRLGALVLSLAGIAVMVGAPGAGRMPLPGVVLALAASVVYALYIPLLGRLQTVAGARVASTYIAAGAGACFAVVGVAEGTLRLPQPAVVWGVIAVMGTLSTVGAFLAFLAGLKVLGPVRTAIMSTVEPFWTAVAAAVLLGQGLGGRTLVGGALIATAVVVLARRGIPSTA
ncbi:MAG TPA: DMT family transporter [Gemmatimonadaceae bacterium]|nr:DMT family transporter [Gemmatimonadaceae bacterium]